MKQFVVLLLVSFSISSAQAISWNVTRYAWTDADEAEYSQFVQSIGLALESGVCDTAESCIKNAPGNFLKNAEDAGLAMHVDCADLPYALRSYFAMKKGLPFSYASEIVAAPAPAGEELKVRDIRYSSYGNLITARKSIVQSTSDFNAYWDRLIDIVASGMYRTHPIRQNGSLESDMYSTDIKSIKPGTNIYDPAGHVAVVYKIGSSGRIFFIDAHPDNSLTRGSYGQKFARSRPFAGAGFRNFRPIRVVDGRAKLAANEEIPNFSTVQYFGTNPAPEGQSWSKGLFILNGEALLYYDYVRAVMAGGRVTVDPILELTEMVDGLCLDAKDRVRSVKDAVKNGLSSKPHIGRLPYNIFGTDGEWESFSTPSRDARLKTSFKELHDNVEEWLRMYAEGSPRIVYAGANLKGDLRAAYDTMVGRCSLKFENTAGERVRFTLNDLVDNIWKLSFSPYHCPELRWGGIGGLSSSCSSGDKVKWYKAQAKLRNQIERTYEVRMNYSAEELLTGSGMSLGVSTPPEVDVRKLLN